MCTITPRYYVLCPQSCMIQMYVSKQEATRKYGEAVKKAGRAETIYLVEAKEVTTNRPASNPRKESIDSWNEAMEQWQ